MKGSATPCLIGLALALVGACGGDDSAPTDVGDDAETTPVDTSPVDTAPLDTRPVGADGQYAVVRSVLVNGRTTVIVAPGAELTVTLGYTIWSDPGCPACGGQILMAISDGSSVDCAYDGAPGVYPGVRAEASVKLTAPLTPGTYGVRWKLDAEADCAAALAAYPTEPAAAAQTSLEFLVQ